MAPDPCLGAAAAGDYQVRVGARNGNTGGSTVASLRLDVVWSDLSTDVAPVCECRAHGLGSDGQQQLA